MKIISIFLLLLITSNLFAFDLILKDSPHLLFKYQHSTPKVTLDAPVRGWRDNSGNIKALFSGHNTGLYEVNSNKLTKVYDSPLDASWPSYNYLNWITSPYYLSNSNVVYALGHSEWYYCLNQKESKYKCNTKNNRLASWSNAISSYISYNNGFSWVRKGIVIKPMELKAEYRDIYVNKIINYGYFQPSNIIFSNNKYRALIRIVERDKTGKAIKVGLLPMSNTNLLTQKWNISNTLLSLPGVDPDQANITYNTHLRSYLLIFWDYNSNKIAYTTFKNWDKIKPTEIKFIQGQENIKIPKNIRINGFHVLNYPTAMWDTSSQDKNYNTTDKEFYLLMNNYTPTLGDFNRDLYYQTIIIR